MPKEETINLLYSREKNKPTAVQMYSSFVPDELFTAVRALKNGQEGEKSLVRLTELEI